VKDTNVESDTTSQCPPQGAIPPPQRPSILERLSNEILSKVFLISRNLYLLDTCHKIKDALTIDVLLNELVLLPFSRSGICERHKVYINNLEDCYHSQPRTQKPMEAPNDSQDQVALQEDSEYGVYGEFASCRTKVSNGLSSE